jgi:hypothetical protein
MRHNLYDWMKMSDDHRRYVANNYPVAARLGLGSETYDEYHSKVRALKGPMRSAFVAEFQHWYCEFGIAWNQLGGIQEYSVGEYTKTIRMGPKANRLSRRRPSHIRGLSPRTGMSCIGALDDWENGQSIWYDDPDDLATGTSDPHQNDWSTGTPSTTPSLPAGYFWCPSPPSGLRKTGVPKVLSAYPGWTKTTWAGADNQLYLEYFHQNSNTQKWGCPKSNVVTTSQRRDIKSIQTALQRAGYSPGTIDGIIGEKTCKAAYAFKRDTLNNTDVMLDEKFYAALGLGGKNFGESYGRLCAMYYKHVPVNPDPVEPTPDPVKPRPTPDPVVTPDDDPPKIEKAGIPWWAGLLLGLGAVGAVVSTQMKDKK